MTEPVLDRLVIVGTGLMGASLASAVKAAGLAKEVIGLDPSQAEVAKRLGHVDRVIGALEELVPASDSGRSVAGSAGHSALRSAAGSARDGAGSNQLAIVVACPVHTYPEIFESIQRLSQHQPLFFVTDIGSTKTGVLRALPHLGTTVSRFVSSHPMAGSEKQGAIAALKTLFQGARVLISPLTASGVSAGLAAAKSDEDAVAAVENFWIALGAQPSNLPIEDHDALLAMISHLPHLVAYSLAGAIAESPLAGAAQALHGGGLRDTTRIAASSPELWADIFLDNREQLLAVLKDYSLELETMQQVLAKSDRSSLTELLSVASHWRKGFL